MIKASEIIQCVKAKVGRGYVYSLTGEICTIDLLKAADKVYGKDMGVGYFQRNGDYKKGRCARWLGVSSYDCSGLIKKCRRELSGVWQDVSAQGLFDQCTAKKGTISSMPPVPGTLVFMFGSKQGRIVHVGMYIGNGQVIESRGVDYGVVITKLSDRAWTHWGQPAWLEYNLNSDGTKIVAGTATDAGDNSTEKPSDIEMLANSMVSDGLITDKSYWIKVLKGELQPDAKYLQIAFQRATAKI